MNSNLRDMVDWVWESNRVFITKMDRDLSWIWIIQNEWMNEWENEKNGCMHEFINEWINK